jgi:hypothetical protein
VEPEGRNLPLDLELLLPGDTPVSVPFRDTFVARSPYELVRRGERHYLCIENAEVEVRLAQPAGGPLGDIALLRGGFLSLAPVPTCRLRRMGRACPIGHGGTASVDDVVGAVRAVLAERPVEMVSLWAGRTDAEDRGIAAIEPYIRAIKRSFDVLVGVDAVPPETNDWIDRTYAMGVDTIAYDVGVFGPKHFERVFPGLTRERYLSALSYAVSVFPRGAVASNLLVGLEPPQSTLLGIESLCDLGVVPVLPLYRPLCHSCGIDLRAAEMPEVEDLAILYGHLYEELKRRKLPGTWARTLSVVTTPLEARFFGGEEAKLQLFLRSVFGARFGYKLSARLADLRRALRVKEVRDSLDSSGL